jgi:hypothetical protein
MTDDERAKKLEELCLKFAESFTKEGKASGLPPTDGILALMNFAADATVLIAAQCEKPSDFIGWATHTFFKSLKVFADTAEIDIDLIVNQESIDKTDDGGVVH